jgi:flagellar basal body-associated protein FliL
MIGGTMNLLAIIIIVLALATAAAIIYAAWELSSDKWTDKPGRRSTVEGETRAETPPEKNNSPES